jgi:hypothetical protein
VVLDFDPGHDMAALGANLGERLKPTALRVRTRKGGEHWYYDLDADKHGVYETIRLSANKIATKVNVRSFHSYVLLPPSRTADGSHIGKNSVDGDYTWIERCSYGRDARGKNEVVSRLQKAWSL